MTRVALGKAMLWPALSSVDALALCRLEHGAAPPRSDKPSRDRQIRRNQKFYSELNGHSHEASDWNAKKKNATKMF